MIHTSNYQLLRIHVIIRSIPWTIHGYKNTHKMNEKIIQFYLFQNFNYKIMFQKVYMCQSIQFLRHTYNNHPLDLKPIDHKPKSHLLKVSFSFLLAQQLGQRVSHILYGVNSSHLDELLLEIFMNKMESSLNMLELLVRPWFPSKRYGTIVVVEEWNDI